MWLFGIRRVEEQVTAPTRRDVDLSAGVVQELREAFLSDKQVHALSAALASKTHALPEKFRSIVQALQQCGSQLVRDGGGVAVAYDDVREKATKLTLFLERARTALATVEKTPQIFVRPWNEIALGFFDDFLKRVAGHTAPGRRPSSELVARLADQSSMMLVIASKVGLYSHQTRHNEFGLTNVSLKAGPKEVKLKDRVKVSAEEAQAAIEQRKKALKEGRQIPAETRAAPPPQSEEQELKQQRSAASAGHLGALNVNDAQREYFKLKPDGQVRFLLEIAEKGDALEERRKAAVHNIAKSLETALLANLDFLSEAGLPCDLDHFVLTASAAAAYGRSVQDELERASAIKGKIEDTLKKCAVVAQKRGSAGFSPQEWRLIEKLTKPPEPEIEAYKLA